MLYLHDRIVSPILYSSRPSTKWKSNWFLVMYINTWFLTWKCTPNNSHILMLNIFCKIKIDEEQRNIKIKHHCCWLVYRKPKEMDIIEKRFCVLIGKTGHVSPTGLTCFSLSITRISSLTIWELMFILSRTVATSCNNTTNREAKNKNKKIQKYKELWMCPSWSIPNKFPPPSSQVAVWKKIRKTKHDDLIQIKYRKSLYIYFVLFDIFVRFHSRSNGYWFLLCQLDATCLAFVCF